MLQTASTSPRGNRIKEPWEKKPPILCGVPPEAKGFIIQAIFSDTSPSLDLASPRADTMSTRLSSDMNECVHITVGLAFHVADFYPLEHPYLRIR